MQYSHGAAETCTADVAHPHSQGNFRNQNDGRPAEGERCLHSAEIYLRLAAPGYTMEQRRVKCPRLQPHPNLLQSLSLFGIQLPHS